MAKNNDLENGWLIGGDYYQQMKIYCTCDYCGAPIYEGDTFHIIGRKKTGYDKVCEDCHQKKVAGE